MKLQTLSGTAAAAHVMAAVISASRLSLQDRASLRMPHVMAYASGVHTSLVFHVDPQRRRHSPSR